MRERERGNVERSDDFRKIVAAEEDSDQSTGNPAKSRRLQVSYPSRRNRYTQEEWLPHPAKRQTPLLPLTHRAEIKIKIKRTPGISVNSRKNSMSRLFRLHGSY